MALQGPGGLTFFTTLQARCSLDAQNGSSLHHSPHRTPQPVLTHRDRPYSPTVYTDKERNASQKLSTSHDHSSAKLYTERLHCSHSIAHSHRATQGGAAPTVSLSHCAVSAFKACRRSRALTVTRRQEREATAPSSERSVPGSGAAPARHHPRRPPPRSVRSLDRTHQR